MRITKISVKGLFGMFDHEIPLNRESRITIVHGPNGVGKTVLLRLVHGLFHYEYGFIGEIPFVELHIEFEHRNVVSVERVQTNDVDGLETALHVSYEDGTENDYNRFVIKCESEWISAWKLAEPIAELRPDLHLVVMPFARQQLTWRSRSEDHGYSPSNRTHSLTIEDMLRKYPTLHNEIFGELPDWFQRLKLEVGINFVWTERLKHFDSAAAFDYVQSLKDVFIRHGELELGDVIPGPTDAISNLSVPEVDLHQFDVNTQTIQDFEYAIAERIVKIDDLDKIIDTVSEELAELSLDKIDTCHKADLEEERMKLQRQMDMIPRIFLFYELANARLLFKKLDHDRNVLGQPKMLAQDGTELPLSALSSGEQHLLVLYNQLLFRTEPDTLVMIDEPELSMNVVWQRNFIKDLQRIIELRNFDVLIATHSPEVIYDKWDWTVALGARADD